MRRDNVSLDNCLKCSDCNTACPVSTAQPAFPGPKHLGPELERLRREGLPCDNPWVEYCLGCDRCNLACPNQVDVAGLIARAKARHDKPRMRKLRDYWLARPARLGTMLSILPPASNALLGWSPVRALMSATMGIAKERDFPPYRMRSRRPRRDPSLHETVFFFPGCAIRYNEPELGAAVRAVLRRNGVATEEPSADCCGLPALANGDEEEARRRARKAVAEMAAAVDRGLTIVTACTSCGHMIKSEIPALFEGEAEIGEMAKRVAAHTSDLGEWLMARADSGRLDTGFRRSETELAYHAPCHQMAQGIGRPWYHLLRRVPGVKIVDLDAGCCGMAGTFGFKQEKYATSMAVGQRLFDGIRTAAPEAVVTECPTCRMQIAHGARVRAIHPVEILLRAYGAETDAP